MCDLLNVEKKVYCRTFQSHQMPSPKSLLSVCENFPFRNTSFEVLKIIYV